MHAMKASDLPPILRQFLVDPLLGGSVARQDIPVPKKVARDLRREQQQRELFEKRRLAANIVPTGEEAGQGPERLIGPRNPEHPGVNNDQGGHGVE
jgi:hypothetical protein